MDAEALRRSRNRWRVTAIIFIILFLLTILIFGWFISYSVGLAVDQTSCSNDICYPLGADSFYYNIRTRSCTCYYQGEVIKQMYIWR